ncbi:SMI1/KNR4 family protein [Streptomyces sp. NPDC006267]|uniref:SMI1/KNR4 family protein n=1 Tax=Streptomyces sp. NPDC006267 TaxID=3157173 RepID=UPI0033B03AD9
MSNSENITSPWARIVLWLESNAPISAQALNPPAQDDDINKLNEQLGFSVPQDLETLLRINNGSTAKGASSLKPDETATLPHFSSAIFPRGHVFLDSQEIAAQHSQYLEFAREYEDSDYWQPEWLPVMQKIDAPYGFLLDTGQGEIYSYSEGSYPARRYPSLSHILTRYADFMEQGLGCTVVDGTVLWS